MGIVAFAVNYLLEKYNPTKYRLQTIAIKTEWLRAAFPGFFIGTGFICVVYIKQTREGMKLMFNIEYSKKRAHSVFRMPYTMLEIDVDKNSGASIEKHLKDLGMRGIDVRYMGLPRNKDAVTNRYNFHYGPDTFLQADPRWHSKVAFKNLNGTNMRPFVSNAQNIVVATGPKFNATNFPNWTIPAGGMLNNSRAWSRA